MRRTQVFSLFAALLISMYVVSCAEFPVELVEALMMNKITSPEEEDRAQNYIDLLRERDFEEVERDLDPRLQDGDTREKFNTMADLIPGDEPKSIKVVGFNVASHKDSSKTITIALEYEFPNQWLVATIAMDERAGVRTITAFRLDPMQESLESQNRFTFTGKHFAHYIILLLGVAALAVSIYGFITCLRTPMGKKKWLWAVICLVDIGRFSINWTTGATAFTPISVNVGMPPANAGMVPYGPWTVWVSLPVGAIVFLVLRGRLSRPYRVAPESQAPETPACK